MKFIATAALAATAIVGTAGLAQGTAAWLAPHSVVKHAVSTQCEYEDSRNCYWNAATAGAANGGHSYYSIRVGSELCTVYTDRDYNRTHGYCTNLR